jgi:hypothetical protein
MENFSTLYFLATYINLLFCQGQLKIVGFRQDKNVGFWQRGL